MGRDDQVGHIPSGLITANALISFGSCTVPGASCSFCTVSACSISICAAAFSAFVIFALGAGNTSGNTSFS